MEKKETHCHCLPGREQEGKDELFSFQMTDRWLCFSGELTERMEVEAVALTGLEPHQRSDRGVYISVKCMCAFLCVHLSVCVSVSAPCYDFQ